MLQSVRELGYEEGWEESRIQTMEEVAKKLIDEGSMSKKHIVMITGLDLRKINKLAKEIKQTES